MEQEHIYRLLLEIKEDSGKTNAKLDDIKESMVDQSIKHDKLEDKHNALQSSHDSFKGRYLAITSFIGIAFGAFLTWLFGGKK